MLHLDGVGNVVECHVNLRTRSIVEGNDVRTETILAIEGVLEAETRGVILAKNLDARHLANHPTETRVGNTTTGELQVLVNVVGELKGLLILTDFVALTNHTHLNLVVSANSGNKVGNLLHVWAKENRSLLHFKVKTNLIQSIRNLLRVGGLANHRPRSNIVKFRNLRHSLISF